MRSRDIEIVRETVIDGERGLRETGRETERQCEWQREREKERE